MNKNAILDLANHLEQNVRDEEFSYGSSARCVLGHAARRAGELHPESIAVGGVNYWKIATEIFGSKRVAEEVFVGHEFKYKGDTRNFIKRLLAVPAGPETEIIKWRRADAERHRVGRYRLSRTDAVRALRSLATTGEYRFDD